MQTPRRSRNLTHVRSQALTLVVRTDEQAAGWGAVEAGRWRGWRAVEVSSGPEPAVDPMVANEGRAAGPVKAVSRRRRGPQANSHFERSGIGSPLVGGIAGRIDGVRAIRRG